MEYTKLADKIKHNIDDQQDAHQLADELFNDWKWKALILTSLDRYWKDAANDKVLHSIAESNAYTIIEMLRESFSE